MFTSPSSLQSAIEHTTGIAKQDQEKIRLTGETGSAFTPVDFMIVNKNDKKQVLGNYTVTYLGVIPGRGKDYSCVGFLA